MTVHMPPVTVQPKQPIADAGFHEAGQATFACGREEDGLDIDSGLAVITPDGVATGYGFHDVVRNACLPNTLFRLI
jgi:hypothetical protein